ncbi:MAG: efflux RND transporter periplasmic adaptor subunit [Salinibacter sp.]
MADTDRKWYYIGGGILLGAVALIALLRAFAPQPETQPPPPQSPLVSTVPVDVRSGSLLVRGTGTVRPVREIQLTAQVAGRLVDVDDALVSGGRFEAGEVLARLDPSDYRNAVQQAEAQVTQARVQLLQAREQAGAARRDYERVRERTGPLPAPDSTDLGRLVFNEPQVAQAEATLESARAALDNARTRLERTTLEVPFNGMVRTKQADLGAYLAPGTPVATVYGTDVVEVVVSLPSRKAALIQNLWSAAARRTEIDLPATVSHSYGGETFSWSGSVHRVEGAISEQTRTVDVVVRVEDPYRLDGGMEVPTRMPEQPTGPERPPLAVGTYTTVDIQGRREGTYHVVPRRAVHTRGADQSPTVWIAAGDSMLVEREVQTIQTVEEQTYLAPTLAPDARVITSDLRVHTDSMRIRVAR